MGKLKLNLAISLDGYAAGPDQSVDNPLGVGGEQLHEWALALEAWRAAHGEQGGERNPSSQIIEEMNAGVGAVVMGRNMFGGHPGPWRGESWTGWWGEDPPFHKPVFVVTHHRRAALTMKGGTTFHFVTEGIAAAYEQARAAAQDQDILLSGGASIAQQFLSAGLVDEVNLSIVPALLGAGERLLDRLKPAPKLEQVRVIPAPGVTHVRYRVVK
jgi:dihydrofolate reductase